MKQLDKGVVSIEQNRDINIQENQISYYDEEFGFDVTMTFKKDKTCTPQVVDILKKILIENI